MSLDDSRKQPGADLLLNQMDLSPWPGPAETEIDITHLFKSVALAYQEAGKQIVRTLEGAIKVISVGTHDSPPAVDVNALGAKAMADIHQVREELATYLVDEFDCDSDRAESAALKVDQEHIDEYPDMDDLAEFVYATGSFWDE